MSEQPAGHRDLDDGNGPAGPVRRPLPGGLHGHPPLTPAAVVLKYWWTVPLLMASFAVLAVLAWRNDGSALHTWDEPVQHWVETNRTEGTDILFRTLSQLGGFTVVALGLAILLLLLYRRCHSLALVLFVAVIARPPLEFVLKEVVNRPRPDFDQLVAGTGFSFPSGHVMAAVALWGLVPPVVEVLTHKRSWWWASVVGGGVVVLSVALSRVYLGVHWLSDVVGAMILGSLYLLAVEWLLEWHHDRRGCAVLDETEAEILAATSPTRRLFRKGANRS